MNSFPSIAVAACTLFLGSAAWSQPADPKLPHACDVITDEDAQHVLGKGARLFRSGANCNIQLEDNKFLTLGIIEARIDFASDQQWAATKRSMLMMYSLMNSRMSARQVSGLGDDAYATSPATLFSKSVSLTLSIKKGNAKASVSGLYSDFETREEIIRYVGERLVAGM